MNSPGTYAEWMVLLDQFKAGNDTCLKTMQHGSITWTNVVAERWTKQMADALSARLQALSKQLQTSLDRTRGDASLIASSLIGARRGVVPLRVFVSLPCLPDHVRTHLESELNRWITETQNALERHAKQEHYDQGLLLKTIRNHPLKDSVVDVSSLPETNTPIAPPVRGRRIIL